MDAERLTELALLGERIWRAGVTETRLDAHKFFLNAIVASLPHSTFNRTRTTLLRRSGIRVGARSLVMGPIRFTGPGDARFLFSIGDDTFITGPVHVDLGAAVRIGDQVRLGQHVTLLTLDHEIGPPERRCGRLTAAPIEIGDGAWLSSNVTLLPGVAVGSGAVVGAGALVSKDVPPNTLVAGVPARVVRNLAHEATPSGRRQRASPTAYYDEEGPRRRAIGR
jgi:maltose O-acetyltransferase